MSKIRSADDLSRVDTLGFRGEALHAIGAVSTLTLTTCERGARSGSRIVVLAGDPIESSPAAHPQGTTVEVRNLFFNLPVRRGFLGTQRAETNASYDNGMAVLRSSRPRRRGDRATHRIVREACKETRRGDFALAASDLPPAIL